MFRVAFSCDLKMRGIQGFLFQIDGESEITFMILTFLYGQVYM